MNIVLLSGGLDSAVVLALALQTGPTLALSFDYGQRHRSELTAARQVAHELGASFKTVTIDPTLMAGSALVDPTIPVPKGGPTEGVPVTYVPGRNMLFLAHAASYAEGHGIRNIWLGVNAIDYSGYPDCRPEFIQGVQNILTVGTKDGRLRLVSPLLHCTKAEIIRKGLSLQVPFHRTISCYDADADGRACGACDSCRIRRAGFEAAGATDPTRYR